jgi:hypothetical protein
MDDLCSIPGTGGDFFFLFAAASRPALEPIQPRIQLSSFIVVKRPQLEAATPNQ